MITEIRIENFKSIANLTLQPGRVTVLIGENGSGKSNILEAIAFGAGAAGNKLDREFLYSRGIRVTDYDWMRSAFLKEESIGLSVQNSEVSTEIEYIIDPIYRMDDSFEQWSVRTFFDEEIVPKLAESEAVTKKINEIMNRLRGLNISRLDPVNLEKIDAEGRGNGTATFEAALRKEIAGTIAHDSWLRTIRQISEEIGLSNYLIYAPENSILRAFDPEGAIEPIGSKGEGLLKLLQSFDNEQYQDRFTELKELLHTLGWFEDLSLPTPDDTIRDRIRIQDGLLPPDKSIFDQRSANEGFLLLLFYFVLFLSWRTPKFFAIDNIDTALNPKLCATLMRQLAILAAKYDKQVIFTTHNPAVLDGLDLNDDEQRLFVVSRNDEGETKIRRVSAPQPRPGERPIKLSEAFLRGLIGGLPKNF